MANDESSDSLHHIDIAALSAGVVAVSVSLFVAPGEYTLVNVVVSIVLFLVIFAYVWQRRRGAWLQSLAIAAVLGFAAVPAIGFFDEMARSRLPTKHLTGGIHAWNCELDPCRKTGEHESRVPARDVFIGWFGVFLVFFIWDVKRQARQRTLPPLEDRIAKAACLQAAATLAAASRAERPNGSLDSEADECSRITDKLYNQIFMEGKATATSRLGSALRECVRKIVRRKS
jgi:hypothetical protein